MIGKMDLRPSGFQDGFGSLNNRNDLPGSIRREPDEPVIIRSMGDAVDNEGEPLVQRCVIIQRDEKGYGLTVSGDNPVFVQSVKEDGAAAKAGVQRGDRIIKVNGTLVTQSNHVEVVKLIKSGSYVALTLLSRPSGQYPFHGHPIVHSPSSSPPSHPNLHHQHSFHSPQYNQHNHIHHGNMNATNRSSITGPIPVDGVVQQQINHNRVFTMKQMLEQDLAYVAKLRSEYAKTQSEKIKMELEAALQRVKHIEDNICLALSQSNNRQSSRSPNAIQSPPSIDSSDTPPPPPPPRRHTSLPHQSSLPSTVTPPVPPMRVESKQFSASNSCDNQESSLDSTSVNSQYPLSHSMDNIQKINAWMASGPTHSRQRSSPDAILHHVENVKQTRSPDLSRSHSDVTSSRKLHSSDSFSELESKRRKTQENNVTSRASSFGAYDSTSTDSPRITPPGTPPPPYSTFEKTETVTVIEDEAARSDESPMSPTRNCGLENVAGDRRSGSSDSQINIGNENDGVSGYKISPFGAPGLTQHTSIMTMEEEDCPSSDNEITTSDDHGPFNSWNKLKKHHGHLSVFLHYLICNSDPSTAFFYLISTLYREGNIKDMKKWAYEIHSTFLVPVAPLKVNNIDDYILHEIGNVLQKESDKEDVLRTVFNKARKKAFEELNEQLADFRNKRSMGLASLYGPTDSVLEEAIHDKNKEMKIIEARLLKFLDSLSEDLENAKDRDSAMASALATVLYKVFGIKNPNAMVIIERCPQFVAKDTRSKGIKFLKGSKKSIAAHGHHFVPQHFIMVTYCNHCQLIIWGVGNQGYQCQYCEMNIHKSCVRVVEETCAVARGAHKKDKKKDRVAGLMENIIKGRKPSQTNPSAFGRRFPEDVSDISNPFLGIIDIQTDSGSGDKSAAPGKVERLRRNFESVNENEDRMVASNGKDLQAISPGCSGNSNHDVIGHVDGSKKVVTRSESLKTRREAKHSFRKRSDPNIPRSNSDVDGEDRTAAGLNHSGSSSNSSLSAQSLDSPSNSLETVHKPASTDVSPQTSLPPSAISQLQKNAVIANIGSSKRDDNDSDFDVELNPPNWQDGVDWEIIRHMKPKEKKRQDVINELLHTERTHVRNLKVLDKVFYRPMQAEQVLLPDQIKLLFPNLEAMIDIHGQLNNRLKNKKRESPLIGDIGDILLEMFDGTAGEIFREAAATFCKNQSIALEALKVRQKKDQKLAQFLSDASSSPYCRRFELKDIIPTGMQRLTKYPLLLENLAKYTCPSTVEYTNIVKVVDCSKQILNYVNQAVKEAENCHRLGELQKKIDWGPFEKSDHPISLEFKNLDLTKHKMLHEGYLQWRFNRQKLVDLHVLLLEDIFVLLQKQDEKYILKFHSTSITGREETKQTHSPIIKVGSVLTRNVATDKRAFFLVSTQTTGPQIYELVAQSTAEQKTWLRHITEATDTHKAKEGKSKLPDHTTTVSTVDIDRNRSSADDTPVEESIKVVESLANTDSQETEKDQESTPSDAVPPDNSETSVVTSPDTKFGEGPRNATGNGGAASESDEGEDGALASSSSSSVVSKQRISPSPQRRFQRVEILQIAEGPPLIEPSEVIISESAVLQTAEPVLAPIEKLRRQNKLIKSVLEEKHSIVAEILNIPEGELEKWDNETGDNSEEPKDVKDLVVAAMEQASRLTDVISENLNVSEEDAISAGSEVTPSVELTTSTSDSSTRAVSPKPGRKTGHIPSNSIQALLSINTYLNEHLTQLLALVTEREEERKRLRSELRSSREQIHRLHETYRRTTPVSQSPSHSRPNSFVSISSSTSEICDNGDHVPIVDEPVGDSEETSNPLLDDFDMNALAPPLDARPPSIIFEAYNSNVDLSGEERHVQLFVDAPSESSTDHPNPVVDTQESQVSPKPEPVTTILESIPQLNTSTAPTLVKDTSEQVSTQLPLQSSQSNNVNVSELGIEF